MKEQWRDIPGFKRYRVSNLGRVFSCNYKGSSVPKLLTPTLGMDGYLKIGLYRTSGERKSMRLNRLVLLAFCGAAKGRQAAHLDGDKENNFLGNLQWATSLENHAHKRRHGTHQAGVLNSRAKLSEKDVLTIRRLYASGRLDGVQLAKRYKTPHTNIYSILNRKNWKHI